MPTYVAFLRAINLGPTRQFPKAAIKSATEAAGGVDVETYLNTGNVRLTTPLRSRAKIEAALERAYAADRGFAVPTIVLPLPELTQVAADAVDIWAEAVDRLGAEVNTDRRHHVSLLKEAPTPDAALAIESLSTQADLAIVRGRAVHLLLSTPYHSTRLGNSRVEALLGVATNRAVSVIGSLAQRWAS
ncbi:MAG: DUF1697 domain-containing protein [Nocardioides sp.]